MQGGWTRVRWLPFLPSHHYDEQICSQFLLRNLDKSSQSFQGATTESHVEVSGGSERVGWNFVFLSSITRQVARRASKKTRLHGNNVEKHILN
jgi:hypothetical protein